MALLDLGRKSLKATATERVALVGCLRFVSFRRQMFLLNDVGRHMD